MLLALLLTCLPVPPQSQTFTTAKTRLEQTVPEDQVGPERFASLELFTTDGRSLWKQAKVKPLTTAFFSEDGRWVGTVDSLNASRVRAYGPNGAVVDVDPLAVVTDDEKRRMTVTSCGRSWFRGMRFEKATLTVGILQANDPPAFQVVIDLATQKLSRRPIPKPGR
ncbi:MAG: hypothetical protein IPJ65_19920 [Archangiaceae bacterium]|nr:hypothetical protein [Archangiaceae bacterium]